MMIMFISVKPKWGTDTEKETEGNLTPEQHVPESQWHPGSWSRSQTSTVLCRLKDQTIHIILQTFHWKLSGYIFEYYSWSTLTKWERQTAPFDIISSAPAAVCIHKHTKLCKTEDKWEKKNISCSNWANITHVQKSFPGVKLSCTKG